MHFKRFLLHLLPEFVKIIYINELSDSKLPAFVVD